RYLLDIENQYATSIRRLFSFDDGECAKQLPEQIKNVEAPFIDYTWPTSQVLREEARRAGAGVLLTGHWGDHITFSSAYLIDLCRSGKWSTAPRHLREYDKWYEDPIATTISRRLLKTFLRETFPQAFAYLKKARNYFRGMDEVASIYNPRLIEWAKRS